MEIHTYYRVFNRCVWVAAYYIIYLKLEIVG